MLTLALPCGLLPAARHSPAVRRGCPPPSRAAVAAELDAGESFQVSLLDGSEGKRIECSMMETAELDGELYASLLPRDTPAILATLDAEQGVLAEVEDPGPIRDLLPAARRACGEYGLELLDTAFTLTVSGDVETAIDDAGEDSIAGDLADDDELDMADDADEDDADAGDVVGAFSRGGGKYYVMALSAPLVLVGRQASLTDFVIPSEEEVDKVGPLLELKMRAASEDDEEEEEEDWPEV